MPRILIGHVRWEMLLFRTTCGDRLIHGLCEFCWLILRFRVVVRRRVEPGVVVVCVMVRRRVVVCMVGATQFDRLRRIRVLVERVDGADRGS